MIGWVQVMPNDYWKKCVCSRCGNKFKDDNDMKVGYGGYYFCTKCVKSFKEWLGTKK